MTMVVLSVLFRTSSSSLSLSRVALQRIPTTTTTTTTRTLIGTNRYIKVTTLVGGSGSGRASSSWFSTDIKKGTVKWFDSKKSFGFLTPEDGSEDVFVHQTAIYSEGFRALVEGQSVEYVKGLDAKGRVKATRVTGPNGSLIPSPPLQRTSLHRTATRGAAATATAASFGAPSPNQGVPADMEIHDMDLPEMELDDNEEAELESLQSYNMETHNHDDHDDDENNANKP